MQYLAWPDHGVPSDPQLFLDFTEKVRAVRKKSLLEEIDLSLKHMRLLGTDHGDGNELPSGLGSEDGESPEELILPPSTSIHQYMSAANPPVIIHCSAGKKKVTFLPLSFISRRSIRTRASCFLHIVEMS